MIRTSQAWALCEIWNIECKFIVYFSCFFSSGVDDDIVETPEPPPPVLTHSLSQTFAAAVQEDGIPEIEDVLKKLSLQDLSSKFLEERVDTETLVCIGTQ